MKKYKILPAQIKRGSYHYHLIERIGMIAIYEQRSPKNPDRACGYAVVRIRRKKPTKLPNGVILPYREIFPSPSDFGRYGWFYMKKSKEMALDHFHDLVGGNSKGVPEEKASSDEKGTLTQFDQEKASDQGDDLIA